MFGVEIGEEKKNNDINKIREETCQTNDNSKPSRLSQLLSTQKKVFNMEKV